MEFVGANALIGPKPSPPGKVSSAARRMRVEEQKRTATRLDECFIPSSVCSALRRSHLPPREGIRCGGDFSPSLRGAQTAPFWQRGSSSVRTGSEFRHAAREGELRGLCFAMQKHRKIRNVHHFRAPAGQPEMMHKNFMHRHLHIFVMQRSCMKFYAFRR